MPGLFSGEVQSAGNARFRRPFVHRRRTADAALQAAAAENPEDPKKAVLEFWPEEE